MRLEADGLLVERCVPVGVPGAGAAADDEPGVPPIDIAVHDELSGRRLAVESDGPAYAGDARRARPGPAARGVARPPGLGPPAGLVHRHLPGPGAGGGAGAGGPRPFGAAAGPPRGRTTQPRRPTPAPGSGSEPAGGPEVERQPPPEPAAPPEQTLDDTDLGWGEVPAGEDAHDDWLREQRPPHWG